MQRMYNKVSRLRSRKRPGLTDWLLLGGPPKISVEILMEK